MTSRGDSESTSVSFRLSGRYLEALDDRAESMAVSRGETARRLVIEALLDSHRLELLDEVRALRDEVAELRRRPQPIAAPAPPPQTDRTPEEIAGLREDLARSVEVILVNLHRHVTQKEAAAFVTKHLRRRRSTPGA